VFGESWSSIQLTTAAAACAAVDLHREGRLPESGFVRQEQIDLEHFLSNRFGRYYSTESQHAERVTL
jgi:saccharopine dehydrogenase-like NADP-dependent oxidoreductase